VFKPEKLGRVMIQVPEDRISAATASLVKFRLIHLIRIEETHLGHLGYIGETDHELLREYDDLLKELEVLLKWMDIHPTMSAPTEAVIPEKDVFKSRTRIDEIRSEVEETVNNLAAVQSSLREKTALIDKLQLLMSDLDFSRLSNCTFVNWSIGLVPEGGLDRLGESLSQVHHAFIDVGVSEERTVIIVFGLLRDWPIFERALKGAFFEKMDLPPLAAESVDAILAGLRKETGEIEVDALEQGRRIKTFQQRFGIELSALWEQIAAARRILSARRLFGKIDKSYLITGWIPERLFSEIEVELKTATEGQFVFERGGPEDFREVRKGIVSIPILLNNPMLISPFEKLTSLYGTPGYKEVEPTVLFALSFLLMFGMMFGDLGQGGVLFVLGYLIFRRSYKHIDYGIILMECGLSSAFFGLLYGSVFGLEDLVPALWFRPMENIPYLVKTALYLGVALVSLGLILNLINGIRLKDYESLLSGSGLAGTLFYWILAGLSLKYTLSGHLAPNELTVAGWVAAGLLTLVVLHRPLYRLLVDKERMKDVVGRRTFFTEPLGSIVELLDNLIRFLTHTLSFVRVAAFALSHAALFMAVFSIADIVSHKRGGGISYWLVVVIGNVVIILLEGLVVSIQTVRLEYYEFFSKFFRGGGEGFVTFDSNIASDERRR
jgi:V/A-type H+/Na+-transporting ATPase subunit I